MANELSMSMRMKLDNGFLTVDKRINLGDFLVTQTTQALVSNVQAVGTAAEALVLGEITTPGWAYFENLDATNFVEIGGGSFTAFVKLKPLEKCMFRIGIAAPQAKADTAGINLFYIILDD